MPQPPPLWHEKCASRNNLILVETSRLSTNIPGDARDVHVHLYTCICRPVFRSLRGRGVPAVVGNLLDFFYQRLVTRKKVATQAPVPIDSILSDGNIVT